MSKGIRRSTWQHVFSLVIGVVFVSVTYFTHDLKKSLTMSQSDLKYDIQIYSTQVEKEDLTDYTKLGSFYHQIDRHRGS